MKCPVCQYSNPDSETICIFCGSSLKKKRKAPGKLPIILILIIALIAGILYIVKSFGLISPGALGQSAINQLNDKQMEALGRLDQSSGEEVEFYSQNGVVRYVSMDVAVSGVDPSDEIALAQAFITQHANLFEMANPNEQFFPAGVNSLEDGAMVHFDQTYKGVPVYGSDLIVEVDNQGNVKSIHGGYTPALDISVQPKLSEDEAYQKALHKSNFKNASLDSPAELVIYDIGRLQSQENGEPRLAWKISLSSSEGYKDYFIDAKNGKVLLESSALDNMVINAKYYDLEGNSFDNVAEYLDIYELMDESRADVHNVKENLETTEDFLNSFPILSQFGLGSYDQNIKVILNSVDLDCENEFGGINGAMNPRYGIMFLCPNSSSSSSQDLIAHEFTHYLTGKIGPQHDAGTEAYALNESYSDIFAAFVANYSNETNPRVNNDPWVFSAGNYSIRYLDDREQKCQPKNYEDFISPGLNLCCPVSSDEAKIGCPHKNSTIHTYVAYDISKQIGMNKTEKIFYHTLMNGFLLSDSNFLDARLSTFKACKDLKSRGLFDISSGDCEIVKDSFTHAGITSPTSLWSTVASIIDIFTDDEELIDDEEKVAYINSDGNLWIMNVDGTEKQVVTHYDNPVIEYSAYSQSNSISSVQWSPNGRYLSFLFSEMHGLTEGQQTVSTKLMLYDLEEDITRELTSECHFGYTWEKDSKNILLGKEINWNYSSDSRFDGPVSGIWELNIETLKEQEYISPFEDFPLVAPEVSPDGNYILFNRVTDPSGYDTLYVYSIEEERIIQLDSYEGRDRIGRPSFSLSGDLITFDDSPYFLVAGSTIFLSSIDGKNEKELINSDDNYVNYSPEFSPSGEEIAFKRAKVDKETEEAFGVATEGKYIFIYDLESSDFYQLTNESVSDFEWSSDGKSIIFMPYDETYPKDNVQCARQVDVETGEVEDYFNCYYPIFQQSN